MELPSWTSSRFFRCHWIHNHVSDRAAVKTFPLLVKILDAQDKLSLQVHPPPAKAKELGGEPKSEMWYFAETTPEADIFAGLKRGVTRDEFERKTGDGT